MATVARVACELLVSSVASFVLTWALLPILGLHASPLAILRVTGFFTVIVFATLEAFLRETEDEEVVEVQPEFRPKQRVVWDAEVGGVRDKQTGL
ncbi:hypothetical protein FB45DRAFT_941521 [Roridomyces roridus]|uniref:Uncharacterized protein n=1 Tax=Roridomyces roridus TaxID=1738132 RepID=A0AAD7AZU0_9AGAR|nr:hypothetical protein FB45DRAFT_951679 [Roridomyces roridus]KAJ7611315.1 hypothetical protein FB45DRAFT_941521 [Roridomyces roridus]